MEPRITLTLGVFRRLDNRFEGLSDDSPRALELHNRRRDALHEVFEVSTSVAVVDWGPDGRHDTTRARRVGAWRGCVRRVQLRPRSWSKVPRREACRGSRGSCDFRGRKGRRVLAPTKAGGEEGTRLRDKSPGRYENSSGSKGKGSAAVSEDSLLERVTAAAEERQLSQNTLTAYRRTWLKVIAWAAAEGLALETLPSNRAGSPTRRRLAGRSASHHLQVKSAISLLYHVLGSTNQFAECPAPKFTPGKTELRYHAASVADALVRLAEVVSESNNKEAGELLDAFNEELAKEQPKKSLLQSFWDSLTGMLPTISQMTDIVQKLPVYSRHDA